MSKKKNIENQEKVKPEEKAEEKIAENAPSKKEEKKLKEAEEKIDNLTKEIQELKESVNKEKNDYLRLMADFENFRRHSAEAKLELVSTASAETIKGLLPVLDDCERAIKMLTEADDTAAKEGTELIYNKLLGYLKTK